MVVRPYILIASIAGTLASSSAIAQPVEVKIRSVGFPAATQAGFVSRPGQWMPILCELRMPGSDNLAGQLSSEHIDLDGDRVAYNAPLVLTGGGKPKRVWLYAANSFRPGFSSLTDVNVINAAGATVASEELPETDALYNQMLVLDISARPVERLHRKLQSSFMADDDDPGRRFYRAVAVSRMPAAHLPDRWWGLESVDVVIWDSPDPNELNASQREALIRWVLNGGQLVVGVGANWGNLRDTEFVRGIPAKKLPGIIPLVGDAPTVTVRTLKRFFARYGNSLALHPNAEGGQSAQFSDPISVSTARQRTPGLRTFWDTLPDQRTVDLIVMEIVGRGRVTTVAAALNDLLSVNVDATFLYELLDLSPMHADWIEKEAERSIGRDRAALFEPIAAVTAFTDVVVLFRVVAIIFVVAYGLAAVFGTWWWLGRRGLTHLSWTAFAACAATASVLSLGAVKLIRGVTTEVRSVSFVDLDSGSAEARGPCWFGYRSPSRERIDLTLPGVDNYLRPMSPPSRVGQSRYATPARYAASPAKAQLSGTLLRASLKQFEGYWSGTLNGTVFGRITVDRSSGRLTPDSWIQNDLPHALQRGVLLYLDPRLDNKGDRAPRRPATATIRVPGQPAGVTMHWSFDPQDSQRREDIVPASNVLMVAIDKINAGGEKFYARNVKEYALTDAAIGRWSLRADRQLSNMPDLPTLRQGQLSWLGGGLLDRGMDAYRAALLSSTRNLFLHMKRDLTRTVASLDCSGMVNVDVTHWLMRGYAVLIAESLAPGPATLHRFGKPQPTRRGVTFYRVRIPITFVGQPPAPPNLGGEP